MTEREILAKAMYARLHSISIPVCRPRRRLTADDRFGAMVLAREFLRQKRRNDDTQVKHTAKSL